MKKSLIIGLFIPLLVLFAVTLLISFFIGGKFPTDNFLLNLSAEFVGILVTVSYVAWILNRHERLTWKTADVKIANRLRVLLNATLSGIRSGLGFSPDILNEQVLRSNDSIAAHKEVIRVAEDTISPLVYNRLLSIDSKGWNALSRHITNSHNGIIQFLNIFQSRMKPEQLSILLDLQEALAECMTFYYIFPDLLGVPKDKLPKTKTPPELLQQLGCEETAKDLQRVITLVRKLSQSIDNLH
jgi:hypothetical protein